MTKNLEIVFYLLQYYYRCHNMFNLTKYVNQYWFIDFTAWSGIQIYGGPGSLPRDFKIWPITFQGSGPSGPILLVVKISRFN